ncbi:MAG: methyltransferase domain-containing protein [Actinobacteria bacterium]|nr:methyltransferase domain-containing protein [Actinomycetota bacterium]
MSRIDACPSCGAGGLETFHRAADVPTNSCLLLEDAAEARAYPRGDLELAFCAVCGFITNVAFDPALAEYSDRYEETQGYSATFVDFGRNLAKEWVERYDLHGKHVLEIGCGKGEFLTWMIEAGAGSGVGIDPGVHPERLDGDAAARVDWIADLYDDRYAHLRADAIVCRHTLEHIHPVRGFLSTIRRNLGDQHETVVLFELPDALRVLREVAFWDTYYEHCSYFTMGSLVRLFRACGFDVLNTTYAYEDQYLLVEALPSEPPETRPSGQHPDDVAQVRTLARRFGASFEAQRRRWQERIAATVDRGGRVALWGGGSKAVAFLTTLGDPSLIDAVVDINPHKQGRFIAGTGHPVLGPDALTELAPDLVIAMNPVYTSEIASALDDLQPSARLEAL